MMVQSPTFQRLPCSAHTLEYHWRGFGKVYGGRCEVSLQERGDIVVSLLKRRRREMELWSVG
jgi:hypothetical protein